LPKDACCICTAGNKNPKISELLKPIFE